jgi:drug/metabolite transporter (DMT)-like permease
VSTRAWTGFAALSAIWGVPYLFIKVAVDDGVSPLFVAWSRVTLAAIVLLGLAWRAGTLPSLRGRWRWLALYALVEITIPFPMIGFGEQRVSSSLAAIIIAAVPLIVAGLAIRFDQSERASGRRLVGLLIGLSGVVALVGIDVAGNSRELVGAGAVLIAALGYAIGPMVLKLQMGDLDARATMGGSLGLAALILTPALLIGGSGDAPTTEAWLSIAVLGLVCTALAFVLLNRLIVEIGPGRALVITYINPVVAVGLGILVLDERPGPGSIVGLLLILAGSWISTDGRLPAKLTRRPRPST